MRLGVQDLANVRFAISPLWESLAAYRAVNDPGAHAVHLPWIRSARDLHARFPALSGDLSGLLTPPRCPLAEIEEELAPGHELAEVVLAWWEAAVKPHWPRIRAVLEADVTHRSRQLAEDGIQQVFAGLHPSLRWSDGELVSPDLPADVGGAGLTLTPTAFATRCHLLTGHPAPALIYPARAVGTLWERRHGGEGLARLLGRSRAQILAFTSSPTTTTQLAARTGLSLGAVSQHLTVLRDSGLVTGHRYRHEVNYTASDLGQALLSQE